MSSPSIKKQNSDIVSENDDDININNNNNSRGKSRIKEHGTLTQTPTRNDDESQELRLESNFQSKDE